MIVVSGVIELGADDLAPALAAAREMAQASRAEEGCISYAFYVDTENQAVVRVFEEWRSQEDLELHFQTEHMARFRQAIAGLDIRSRRVQRYEIADVSDL